MKNVLVIFPLIFAGHEFECNRKSRSKILADSIYTTKTDNTLRSLFKKKEVGADGMTDEERVQQAVELLMGMSPEQIISVISAINK